MSWKAQTLGQVLAARSGEALVTREARFTYEQLLEKAKAVAGAMQAMTSVVEGWVREHPGQWLWMHRRWRVPASAGSGRR